MFWRKKHIREIDISHLEAGIPIYRPRSCKVKISSKYNQVLFIPFGKMESWITKELKFVITDNWPLDIATFQNHLGLTLDHYKSNLKDEEASNEIWYSYKVSKAKSQHSFEVDYVSLIFESIDKEYSDGEAEEIKVSAIPRKGLDYFSLTCQRHMVGIEVSQMAYDIFSACEKIRG